MIMLLLLIISLFYFSSDTFAEDFRRRLSQTAEEEFYKIEDDIKAEVIFGRELAARVLGRYPLLKDRRLTEYVNLVGKGLSLFAGRPEIEFHFGVLDTEIVNAFSTPGGYIFITKGAIDLMEDEAELAGVLAHEIAHVAERHIVKEINLRAPEESPITGFAALISGPTGSAKEAFLTLVDKAYEILFERGYKREDELSADRMATVLLATAGYDPSGLLRFLKKVRNNEHEKEIQRTHPKLSERLSLLEEFIKKNQLASKKYPRLKERFYEYVRIH